MRSRQKGPLKLGCCRIPTDRILTSELPRFMRVPFEMRDNKDGITHEDKKQRGQAIQRTELSGRVYRRRRPNGTRQGCRDQLRPTRSIRPQSSAGSLPREDFSSPTLPRNALRCFSAAVGVAHRCNDGLRSCLWRGTVLLEACSAEHGPPLGRTEGNRRLLATDPALRPGLCPYAGAAAPLKLAHLAALGIIVKLFIVKEQLLAGGEDKVLPAIHTPQYLVLECHDPVDSAN
jgi:hypothetical protein